MIKRNYKLAQEEMVGFAVIMVIMGVILLIVFGFMLKSPDNATIESYEVESFIQASLQYTSDCENQLEFMPIQELIIACGVESKCLDERDSCKVLNSTLNELITKGWNVGEKSAVRGYDLKLIIDNQEILLLQKGNKTTSYVGGSQDFARRGKNYEISLVVYS